MTIEKPTRGRDATRDVSVSLAVADHETLREVFRRLSDVPADVTRVSDSENRASLVEIDVGEITPTQQETLALAFEEGYYDDPRRINLGGLSEQLDVSKSAVSQRLRAAETKLVRMVVGEMGSTGADPPQEGKRR